MMAQEEGIGRCCLHINIFNLCFLSSLICWDFMIWILCRYLKQWKFVAALSLNFGLSYSDVYSSQHMRVLSSMYFHNTWIWALRNIAIYLSTKEHLFFSYYLWCIQNTICFNFSGKMQMFIDRYILHLPKNFKYFMLSSESLPPKNTVITQHLC